MAPVLPPAGWSVTDFYNSKQIFIPICGTTWLGLPSGRDPRRRGRCLIVRHLVADPDPRKRPQRAQDDGGDGEKTIAPQFRDKAPNRGTDKKPEPNQGSRRHSMSKPQKFYGESISSLCRNRPRPKGNVELEVLPITGFQWLGSGPDESRTCRFRSRYIRPSTPTIRAQTCFYAFKRYFIPGWKLEYRRKKPHR